MSDARLRVKANKRTGELEIEGQAQAVSEWWDKLWPEVSLAAEVGNTPPAGGMHSPIASAAANGQMPEVFGEFYTDFRPDITDLEKVLVAAAFVQGKDQDRVFTTKAANQTLLDQNIKVANASESIRRLIQTKRAFVVSDGRYRVSAVGFDHLRSIKAA